MPRQFRIVIGAQRSGKSALMDALGQAYAKAGRWACAYNLGMASDFDAAERIEFLPLRSSVEYAENVAGDEAARAVRRARVCRLWRDANGSTYAMRDFNARVAGRFVKSPRLTGNDERALVAAVFRYMGGGGLFIWDDARAAFRHGLTAEANELFTRINHAGGASAWESSRGVGVDVALVFHAARQVNPDLLDAATHMTLLSGTRDPDVSTLDNPAAEAAVTAAHARLRRAARYSRVDLALQSPGGVACALYDPRGELVAEWTQKH